MSAEESPIGEVALHARNVGFDFSESPLHWIPNEPVVSHMMSSLNLILPVAEQMFIETFTDALPYVKDEKLREAMIGFIGQETMHATTHDRALWDFLDRHGIDPTPITRQIEYLLDCIRDLDKRVNDTTRYRVMVEKLALVAGFEHFTAVAGNWALNHPFEDYDADATLTDLFRWHGAEEVEHRSVAFDVARYFGVSRPHLIAAFLVASTGVLGGLLYGTKFLIASDPALRDHSYLDLLREANGAMQRGAFMGWRLVGAAFQEYLRPGFTPEVMGDTGQAVAYLAQSPAAKKATTL